MADKSKKMSMSEILSVINDAMQSTKQSKLSSQNGLHHDEFVSQGINEMFVSKDLSEIGESDFNARDTGVSGVSRDFTQNSIENEHHRNDHINTRNGLIDDDSDNYEKSVNGENHMHNLSKKGVNENSQHVIDKSYSSNTSNSYNPNISYNTQNSDSHIPFNTKDDSVLGGLKDLNLRSHLHDASHNQSIKMNSTKINSSKVNASVSDVNEPSNVTTQFVKSCIYTWMDQNTDVVYDSLKRITMHDCFELDQIMKKIIHEEVKKILFKILSGVAEED